MFGGPLDGFRIVQGKFAPAAASAGTHGFPEVKKAEVPWELTAVVGREEPHEFAEIAAELDVRVEALRRGRTDWGCAGQHRGQYTPNQIERGAPNCPRFMHHHHDAFCKEPSTLELRLADVTKPADGWGSRA